MLKGRLLPIKKTKIKKNDQVLDIASNDGSLLNFYGNKAKTFGIDPIQINTKTGIKINFTVSDFFSAKEIRKKLKKFKIITALSVFMMQLIQINSLKCENFIKK